LTKESGFEPSFLGLTRAIALCAVPLGQSLTTAGELIYNPIAQKADDTYAHSGRLYAIRQMNGW